MIARNKRRSARNKREDAAVELDRYAVIYTRVSDTNEDNNGFSHEFQEAKCRAEAEAQGYTVLATFSDDFPGRYLHERPSLSRLREVIRTGELGKISAVFIWKLDRFSRKLAQRAILVQELREHGCLYRSATEDITDSPEGRLLEAVLGAIAEFEVERTLERSQAGLSVLRTRRVAICAGLARFGYRYNTETRSREIVDSEASLVRDIFGWYLTGDSTLAIAKRLNSLGVPSPAAQRGVKLSADSAPVWHGSTVLAILHDESYAGAPMVSGKKRSTSEIDSKGNAKSEWTDESEWWTTKEGTPAIIERSDFDRAQELILARSSGQKTRNAENPYLLRGMVECAVCGKSMSPAPVTNSAGKVYHYFTCVSRQMGCKCANTGTPVAWLDESVWSEVTRLLSDREAIEERFRNLVKENRGDDLERDLAAHQVEVDGARAAIRRLTPRLEATDDPELIAPLEERLAELRTKIQSHKTEIDKIESKLYLIRNQSEALSRWSAACIAGNRNLKDSIPFDQKRKLLQSLTVRVVARKKEASIKLGIPFVKPDCSPGVAVQTNKQRLVFDFTL